MNTCLKPDSAVRTNRNARVLLVDDHPVVRRGLRFLFSLQPDLCVCGEAEGAAEALARVQALDPHLVVVDLRLKEGSGLELIRRLRAIRPALKILVFSMHDEATLVARARQAGADAFVPKDQGAEKVVATTQALLRGRKSARGLPAAPAATAPLEEAGATDLVGRLSDRELEILQLLGQGLNSRQIAQRLWVNRRTVASHREHLKQKLRLKNAPALVHFALGFVRLATPAADAAKSRMRSKSRP